ncbi:MAG: hypothetical protein AB7R55_16520 [Gemmatimonadales bacterium]
MRGYWLASLLLIAPRLEAQSPGPATGAEVRLEWIQTPAWRLELRDGGTIARISSYGPGPVIGLTVGASLVRELQVFGSGQWNGGGLGDGSGFTVAEIGIAGRLPTGSRFVPRVMATYGRFQETGGVRFSHWSAGAGADVYLSRVLSVGADVRRVDPISATSSRADSVTVMARITRLHLGVALHF